MFSDLRKTNVHLKLERTEEQILTQGLPHTWIMSHVWFDVGPLIKSVCSLGLPPVELSGI